MNPAPQHHHRTAKKRWRAAATAIALVALAGACSSNAAPKLADKNPSTAANSTSTTPSQPPQSTSPEDAQKAAVLASYNSMWVAQMKAYRKADAAGTDLEKYATLDALGKVRIDLARMKERGTVIRGDMGHQVTLTSLDLKAKTPTAALTDCVDLSNWQTWDTKANKAIPLPTAQPRRYLATVKAQRWDGDRWMITDFVTKGSQPCTG
ncbi:hypothetical protein ACFYZ9_38370 [Streptomyces sp. NPDC001691]|uniref:hypothetical protein n=1 Tax=Streptomyces sp. NPDC001691 TaxID=3364600 RepID=UPI00367CB3E9